LFSFRNFRVYLTLSEKREGLRNTVEGLALAALLVFACLMIQRSDRAIADKASKQALAFLPTPESPMFISQDERRVANMFISDTLPRLMKMGLITKYQRSEFATALLVAGPVWTKRTRFVKESLLTAVATYNKANGLSAWTLILDDHDGTLYAQVLPSSRKEVYN
jgi:hypothetical protein